MTRATPSDRPRSLRLGAEPSGRRSQAVGVALLLALFAVAGCDFTPTLDVETPRQLYTLSVDRDETVSSRVRVAIEAVAQQEEELG